MRPRKVARKGVIIDRKDWLQRGRGRETAEGRSRTRSCRARAGFNGAAVVRPRKVGVVWGAYEARIEASTGPRS